jgi:anti-sigma-K factor RskA
MNCEELSEYYELYAIGAADEPERSEIRAHLNRNCEVCMGGMRRARELAALLEGSAEPAAPSPKLRRRILASVGVEERRFGWAPFLAAALALALFAAVYFGGRERDLGNELARVRDINREQNIELTRVNEAFAIINGVDTTVTTFGEGQPQPKGKVFVNPSQGVLLIASNLRPAPSGKVYEMWLVPKGGKPKPAGLFQSSAEGSAMHLQRGSVADAAVVAVTLENESGSDAPTMPILFAAQIPAAQH